MTEDPPSPPYPRWLKIRLRNDQEVMERKRTIAHFPSDLRWETIRVSDRVLLRSRDYEDGRWHPIAEGTIVDVRLGPLSSFVDADLPGLLAGSRDEYYRRWDTDHPGLLSGSDPLVIRVVWCYDAPEFWLAA